MSSEFSLNETEKALLQQLKQQKDQKQQPDWRNPQSFGIPNVTGAMNPLFNPMNLPYPNPRLLAMAANQSQLNSLASSMPTQTSSANSTSSTNNSSFANLLNNNSNNKLPASGIFPTAMPNFPPFNGFVNPAVASNMSRNDE